MKQLNHAEAARLPEGFNFIDPDRLQLGVPVAELALLRRTATCAPSRATATTGRPTPTA